MSLSLAAYGAVQQALVGLPMAGPWIQWPAGGEPAFIGNLRTNLTSATSLKAIFKTIGVIIMLIWVGYILSKIAIPSKGGGARSIQWVGVILGALVAGICLNLESLPNILSVILLGFVSLMKAIGLA